MKRKDIGERLTKLRANVPRINVATALGISESALAMYESGERLPRDEVKIKIAEYYHVSVGELFFGEDVNT